MKRLALILSVVAVPVFAADKAETCEFSKGVVQEAIELRLAGKRENRAIKRLIKSRANAEEALQKLISPLAGWIYSIPEGQLNDETVSGFANQCEKA